MKIAVAEKVLLDKNPVDKFNVAWFKLAEFVGRKEKERALSVYRLLSHSLPDDAFAAQLEGDLFLAFCDDERAVDAYQKAARLYEKNGQYDHAALLAVKIARYAQRS
jgi:predicted negative regulator of RcsB-dependent stress response